MPRSPKYMYNRDADIEMAIRRRIRETRKLLGAELAARRLALGLGQQEVADRIGYTAGTVSHAERGVTGNMDVSLRIAHVLGLDLVFIPRED